MVYRKQTGNGSLDYRAPLAATKDMFLDEKRSNKGKAPNLPLWLLVPGIAGVFGS
jgi:hypothetical protein